jgi:L-lactate utilization protein LutB
MDTVKKWHGEKTAEKLKKNFEKRNIEMFYLEKKEELTELIKSFVKENDTVSYGGSLTLKETGILDFFRNGKYVFLDREAYETREEKDEIYRKSFGADHYFLSAGAVTMDGEILNVDGNGNRIAAMIFGPKKVFVIIGMNKLTADIKEAEERIRLYAGPMDAKVLSKQTPCTVTGECSDCKSPERICNKYLIYRREMNPDRMKVILINESLGY